MSTNNKRGTRRKAADTAFDSALSSIEFVTETDIERSSIGGLSHDKNLEELSLEQVRPYPNNPRRWLPRKIHVQLHTGKISSRQALRQFVDLVRETAKDRGRPFENPFEFIHDDSDSSGNLTKLERRLHELTNLATSIYEQGQLNPVTVIDVSDGTRPEYLIEAGEGRYWSVELLNTYLRPDAPVKLLCRIIDRDDFSVYRQCSENANRVAPTPLDRAREAALLVLDAHGAIPENAILTNDDYREALGFQRRVSKDEHPVDDNGHLAEDTREISAEILNAMGGISKAQFSKIKGLWRLTDGAIEYVEANETPDLSLRVLYDLSKLSSEDQNWYVSLAVQNRWSSVELHRNISQKNNEKDKQTYSAPVREIRRGVPEKLTPEQIAAELIKAEKNDRNRAWAAVKSKIDFLKKVAAHLKE